MAQKTLYLIIKDQWFDLIESGIKKEEYREIKKHWDRLVKFGYTHALIVNGYRKDARRMIVEIKNVKIGKKRPEWADDHSDQQVYVIELGNVKRIK